MPPCLLFCASIVYCIVSDVTSYQNTNVVDYTSLAMDIEKHKYDISYLNQTHIRLKYQILHMKLLNLLNDTKKHQIGKLQSSTRRIVAGRNISISQIPWQVSIREKSSPMCGGSILTHSWIITAAHCLMKTRAEDLTIRLGSSMKTHGGQMYDVRQALIHPKYDRKTKINDVGLICLYTPLRFTSRILPIRLVDRDKKLLAEHDCIVSGWGKLKEKGPNAKYLQATKVKTISMKLCRWSGLDKNAIDPNTMFCAGSFRHGSADACQGDSGGPLVHSAVLVGIVSWGLGCARGNFPGIYTRLSHPAIWDWIYEHISRPYNSTI